MKILLHICCAPCSIYPIRILRSEGYTLMGYFYGANIHPHTEYLKRRHALEDYSNQVELQVIFQKGYDLEGFLQKIVFRESRRCSICYYERLQAAAFAAKKGNFDAFTTTLLYSKFQDHDEVRSLGESLGAKIGINFYYRDFREGWKEGIETSKALGMYRQSYCGCIYSEKERYMKKG
jgi:hypothetical protein